MVKTQGIRGTGQAKFVWSKTQYKSEPLSEDTLGYLSELAQVRKRLFESKNMTQDRLEKLTSRQFAILDILEGWHSIEVRFPAVRQVA
jgi:hypothetical protein